MGIFSSSRSSTSAANGTTVIAAGVRVAGELIGLSGSLVVDGLVEGQIDSQSDVLIGVSGTVVGKVTAKRVYISGVLQGSVSADEVEILNQGQLLGDVLSGDIVVEKGGRFLGSSHGLDKTNLFQQQSVTESDPILLDSKDEKDEK